jgi:hypothetical protein
LLFKLEKLLLERLIPKLLPPPKRLAWASVVKKVNDNKLMSRIRKKLRMILPLFLVLGGGRLRKNGEKINISPSCRTPYVPWALDPAAYPRDVEQWGNIGVSGA